MRVGLISFNGQAGNAIGNHLAEKLAFFVERGADVRVFLQEGARLHPALAQHVHVMSEVQTSGPAWDFLAGADLVIVDFAQAYNLLHYLPLLAGGKPRLVLEYHGITPPQSWPAPQRAVLEKGLSLRGLIWCADFALVHSRFIRDELARSTGFPGDRIFQLDFPLDERFRPGQSSWSLRQYLSIGTAPLLLYVGRLAPNKCVPLLVEAVGRLANQEPAIHAVIAGDDGDIYAEEKRRCLELADRLGVSQRIHFLGAVDDDRLADCYRTADLFVMPSIHEGFCIPVVEAMACGLPVLAARAAALPETVGDAGLTFAPGDVEDLVNQLNRLFSFPGSAWERTAREALPLLPNKRQAEPAGQCVPRRSLGTRIAVVSFRFGSEIVGGAETSMRTIAQALKRQGREIEVFTTCTQAEGDWTNELPAGTTTQDGLTVNRFPMDPHDRERHWESVRAIVEPTGPIGPEPEQAYLEHSIHSKQLIANLRNRLDEFEAIIVGPYLFGLTHDVAQAFPEKTLLLGCFHQEPLARLKAWPKTYGLVGGVLYHSPEERELAQTELGVNHPNSVEIGTFLRSEVRNQRSEVRGQKAEVKSQRSEIRSQKSACSDLRLLTSDFRPLAPDSFLVYCGRYSRQKNVPLLLDFMARYVAERPGRFAVVFMGQGEVAIPKEEWALDLGRVDEATKRAVLGRAAALVQLSLQESLSLVALDAWAEGTPVIVNRRCPVLAGQVRRSGGGWAIENYDEFARTLNELWENPQAAEERGRRGQVYVHEQYRSESAFAGKLLLAIAALKTPLRDQMHHRGLARAKQSTRSAWRERFTLMVENLLDLGSRPLRFEINITPLHEQVRVKTGTRTLLIPVRVHNHGTHAVCAEGPASLALCSEIGDQTNLRKTQLPGLLPPGKVLVAAALIEVPSEPGEYAMRFWLEGENRSEPAGVLAAATLTVGESGDDRCTGPFLQAAQEALAQVEERRRLPDDYLDVTLGRFARWKRWIKSKLLGNFKRGYVDVLSRQQSQVNQQILVALQQLTECCATLDHAVSGLRERIDKLEQPPTPSFSRGSQNRAEVTP